MSYILRHQGEFFHDPVLNWENWDTERWRNGPGNFSGSPPIKNLPSNTEGAGLIPGRGLRSHMPYSMAEGKKELGPVKDREDWSAAVHGVSDWTTIKTAGHWIVLGPGPDGLAIGPMSLTILLACL